MRILILTQKVDKNDDVLGFFHAWLLEFARRCEKVIVVCLEKGEHDLPGNVKIFSLGKEKNSDTRGLKYGFVRILYVIRFMRYIVRFRNEHDVVFVHMNPEYVVLGGPLWKLWRKKIGLWYVHRQVNLKLRIAEKLAHVVFSTTPEAFRLSSKKVHFLGHGVDFSHFTRKETGVFHVPLRVLHVGRITPIKNLDILIDAAHLLLHKHYMRVSVKCIGKPANSYDEEYFKKLKEKITHYNLGDSFSFIGSVPYQEIPRYYREADISVNLTPTGGMDKAVLESIASGTIALSANRAFKELFGEYASVFLYNERNAEDTANKIMNIVNLNSQERREVEGYLYERARTGFDLDTLIKRIVHELHNL